MKEKIEWLKAHKKEVLIGTGIAVGTIALIGIGVYWKDVLKAAEKAKEKEKDLLDSFKSAINSVDDHYCLDLEAVPIKDLGNIGENFLKNTPGTDEDTLVQVIAYIEKKDLNYLV